MSILDGARIEINNMQSDYIELCNTLVAYGDDVAPRGQKTKEILGVTIVHHKPWDSLTQHIGRGSSSPLAALEGLQLVAGESYPKLMQKVAPNTARFQSPDGTFHGAYGPRTGPWMEEIVRRLTVDRDTRQAIVNIWDSSKDGIEYLVPDLPCTLNLHFMIRRGMLELHVTMRSNDIWWGTAYDIFMFTHLQRTVANVLEIGCGRYFHHANSLHVYRRDFESIDKMHAPTEPAERPGMYVMNTNRWTHAQASARSLILHSENGASRDEGGWWRKQAKAWSQPVTGMDTGLDEYI